MEKEKNQIENESKEICSTCQGTGRVLNFTDTGMMDCPRCQGTGYLIKHAEGTYRDWLD